MNICLLTNHSCSNEKNLELARITSGNHLTYAQRHGYTQHIMRIDWEPSKLGWLKTLKELLPQFDLVLGHGIDTLFMNQRITVQDICVNAGHTHGVMMAKEEHTDNFLNNDVSIWWNDKDSMTLIDRLIADYPIWRDYAWLHQSHLFNLLQLEQGIRDIVKLGESREMNASPGGDNCARWKYGTWLCHLLGCDENTKIPAARMMLKKCSSDGCYYPLTETFRRIKRLSDRNMKTVVIGIPNYDGNVRTETADFIMALFARAYEGVEFVAYIPAFGTTVPRMRDLIVHQARQLKLKDGRRAGKLLFIDADIKPTVADAVKLCSHAAPVVGGCYPAKQAPYRWIGTPIPGKGIMQNGLQEWVEVGTGFKCYDLDVFDAIAEAYPENWYVEALPEFYGQRVGFFFTDMIHERRRLSEDYAVDHRWREMGGQVLVDTQVQVGHMGLANMLDLKKLTLAK